ncbi:hypothetical protein [Prescottella equi]
MPRADQLYRPARRDPMERVALAWRIDPATVAKIEDGDLDALAIAELRAYTDALGVGPRAEIDLGEHRIHIA